jgi:hypothetical protein
VRRGLGGRAAAVQGCRVRCLAVSMLPCGSRGGRLGTPTPHEEDEPWTAKSKHGVTWAVHGAVAAASLVARFDSDSLSCSDQVPSWTVGLSRTCPLLARIPTPTDVPVRLNPFSLVVRSAQPTWAPHPFPLTPKSKHQLARLTLAVRSPLLPPHAMCCTVIAPTRT